MSNYLSSTHDCARNRAKCFVCAVSADVHSAPKGRQARPCGFTHEDATAQRQAVACPGLHSSSVTASRCTPGLSDPQQPLLTALVCASLTKLKTRVGAVTPDLESTRVGGVSCSLSASRSSRPRGPNDWWPSFPLLPHQAWPQPSSVLVGKAVNGDKWPHLV